MRTANGWWLAGALTMACASRPSTSALPTPEPSAPVASTTAARPATSPATESPDQPANAAQQAATLQEVADALNLVASVRELAPKSPVPGVRLTRTALLAEMKRIQAQDTPPQLMQGTREVLLAADAIPTDFDLEQGIVRMYTSELAGFYDTKAKRMVLISDLTGDAAKLTLYHELVHALQDQHFDLSRALDWKPDRSDQQAALHALAEGDATAAMMEVLAKIQGRSEGEGAPVLEALQLQAMLGQADPALSTLPGVMLRSMLAPYVDGLAFVQALRAGGGREWRTIDLALKEPPQTTEQLLHPLKYLQREPAHLPSVPVPPSGFEEMYRDVMGEQGTRLLFEEWTPLREAAQAASDWDGDRIVAFRRGDEYVVHWHLVFDNEAASQRAYLTLARGAERSELPAAADPNAAAVRRFGDASAAAKRAMRAELCQARPQRGPFAAARQGRHVGVVFGPYARSSTGVRATGTCPDAIRAARALVQTR